MMFASPADRDAIHKLKIQLDYLAEASFKSLELKEGNSQRLLVGLLQSVRLSLANHKQQTTFSKGCRSMAFQVRESGQSHLSNLSERMKII